MSKTPEMNMSDTPRTDAMYAKWYAIPEWGAIPEGTIDPKHFARQLERENAEAVSLLRDLLANHVRLVESGDCGNWDVDNEKEVSAARAFLAKPRS